ncbi:anti-phage protein KwaB [Vibrio splendidus]|uniref:DUF4868 domain-containing protein n=1 Tax=Vibrio splendidus TaxID=29497 RepID=A0A7Y4FZX1_VIBSP|nr:anti-phage protein KwaB [Vibrio splendidus]NOJ14028.1 DUF4868 domain-containing protein [Vibrio splendidus]
MSQVKKVLKNYIDECDGIGVYFVTHAGDIFDADIDSNALRRFKVDFCNEFDRKYTENENFSVVKLSNYDERKSALFRYDFTPQEMPLEFQYTQKVLQFLPTDNVPVFRLGNSRLNELKAVIVLLQSSVTSAKMAFYQHIFPVSIIGPDKGFLNLTSLQSRLVELEEDILKLNANFVFMQTGKHYLIENVNTLETRLGFKNAIHSRAELYSKKLETTGLVEDLTMFNDRIKKETSFARKLVKVYRNSAVLNENVPHEKIIEFTKKKPHFKSLSMSVNDNDNGFKLDTVGRCKQFLELLDDDFLRSDLTNADYIARTKDRVKNS